MKKLATFLTALCAVVVFAFSGCADGDNGNSGRSGDITLLENGVVFTVKDDIIPLTDRTSLKDYLDALKQNGELEFEGRVGDYGFFIESVFGKTAENGAYWGVYTNLVTLEGDSAEYSSTEWGSYEYAGETLGSANYGISNLPCVSGYIYALILTEYL